MQPTRIALVAGFLLAGCGALTGVDFDKAHLLEEIEDAAADATVVVTPGEDGATNPAPNGDDGSTGGDGATSGTDAATSGTDASGADSGKDGGTGIKDSGVDATKPCVSDPTWCTNRCGATADNCQKPVDCGLCGGGLTCVQNACNCVPEGVAIACGGKACGSATNNCGQSVTCPDTCAAPKTCGGGGAGANACGCTAEPLGTTCAGVMCGSATNNCGTVVLCPDKCAAPDTCGGGGAGANACGCTHEDPADACGAQCNIMVTDNCGSAVSCGNNCGLDGMCPCAGGHCQLASHTCLCNAGPCL